MHRFHLQRVSHSMGALRLRLLLCIGVALCALPAAFGQKADVSPAPHPALVGYFPQWALYDDQPYLVKNLISPGGKAPLVDQINYAQGFVTNGRCSVADPNADLNFTFNAQQSVNGIADSPSQPFRGHLHQLQLLKRKFPHLRILISLEGRGSDFAQDAQPENRQAFVASCVDIFLKGHLAPGIEAPGLFDGIDVDWEFPHEPDAANFQALLREFRRQMNAVRPALKLTIAVGHTPHMYPGTDVAAVASLVDQVGLMTYDFIGPWSDTTGLLAPLSAAPDFDGGTVARSIEAWRQSGVPTSKLLMGVPFYAYGWHQVSDDAHGLFQEGQGIHGDRPYPYIQGLIEHSTVYRDPISQAPWLFDGDVFWTYEDPVSIAYKAGFARDQRLGGVMIWELGEDDASAVLLRAAHRALNEDAAPEIATPELKPVSASPLNRNRLQ
ncbi:glycoside hydrolase family 18 protein [Edaphobacter modestus]|uniref:glycoside hydrolase family 18 protein n=1 Tax=Edaphobacter modestus TaxID=388466 RepID=UPI001F5F903A|nr:glycosyl hydrolase family 18 protein [Edaphobacter modestus]